MSIYLFNPDTDLALSDNGNNYLPPASIRRMAEDLALLPAWYAGAGSAVLLPRGMGAERVEAMRRHLAWMKTMFGVEVELLTEGQALSDTTVIPWGWNRTLRRRLLLAGISEAMLPDEARLDRFRAASSRTCTAEILTHFRTMNLPQVGGEALVLADLPALDAHPASLIARSPSGFLLKSLWSGSGKGLYWCRRGLSPDAKEWATRCLKRDGALMLEPIYNKVNDFAMEFRSDGQGSVEFVGYSRFLTNEKGGYRGNLLASDEEIETWLAQFISLDTLRTVRRTLCSLLSASHGRIYAGFLGVDMMICETENAVSFLHPCVEVNFRMNMGVVAHSFRRFLAPGSTARFLVESFPDSETLHRRHEEELSRYPLEVKNARLISGYLPLTPVLPGSTYRVAVFL